MSYLWHSSDDFIMNFIVWFDWLSLTSMYLTVAIGFIISSILRASTFKQS